jgi:pimeloyl-ACP methyl ester carboxylesterase
MKIRKGFKVIIILIVVICLLLAAIVILKRPHTPRIKGSMGRASSASVASLEKVSLGGVSQWILVRGREKSHPILLFLHGGPGMPMMYLAHRFQRPLEDSFLCVQWDQRGAGKSFHKGIHPSSLTVEQLLSDALELIHLLQDRYGQDKIFLAGHSWGSYLGMLLVHRHPELFHAYIGIGQVVDEVAALDLQDRFIRKRAKETANDEALRDLDFSGTAAHEKWLFQFGAELYGHTGYGAFIKAGVLAPEYGVFDIPKVGKGSSFSSRHMQYNAKEGPHLNNLKSVDVPVYFFTGRNDYVTPFELVEKFSRELEAPINRIVWFERSAHFPFISDPNGFAQALKAIALEILNQ